MREREIFSAHDDDRPQAPPPRPPTPWLTLAFIVACVAAYGGSLVQGGARVSPLYQAGILFGPWVREGELWRTFSTLFTHAGPLHLFMNMSVMWTLAAPLERLLGTARLFVLSLLTAMGSGAIVLWLSFDQPTVGASGMILGYLGVLLPISNRRGRRELGTWLLQIAVLSLLPGVSWQGHLGGFLAGLPLGWALLGGPRRFRLVASALLMMGALALFWAARGGP